MSLDHIAAYYDLLYGNLVEDLPLWETLTEAVEGSILEVGCGTGRLLLPLAELGRQLAGLDLSELALSQARAKIETASLSHRVTLHQADMRHFDLPHKNFAMALLPLNTFMHCHTIDEQLATLRSVHHHLRSGGELVIDLFYPDPNLLAEVDGRLYFEDEFTNKVTGQPVQLYWRHDVDLAEQMRHFVYLLDEIDEAGLVHRTRLPFSLRYFYRYEMELLLQMTGFTVQTIYGDYDLSPFDGHGPQMIFVANKE